MITHEEVLNKHQMNINFSNLIFAAGHDVNVVQWMFTT